MDQLITGFADIITSWQPVIIVIDGNTLNKQNFNSNAKTWRWWTRTVQIYFCPKVDCRKKENRICLLFLVSQTDAYIMQLLQVYLPMISGGS